MLRSLAAVAVIIAFCVLSLGCTQQGNIMQAETDLDRNFGRSYELQKFNQILNPDREANLDPVVGLDGGEALDAKAKYDESFKQEKTQEVVNVLKLQ